MAPVPRSKYIVGVYCAPKGPRGSLLFDGRLATTWWGHGSPPIPPIVHFEHRRGAISSEEEIFLLFYLKKNAEWEKKNSPPQTNKTCKREREKRGGQKEQVYDVFTGPVGGLISVSLHVG